MFNSDIPVGVALKHFGSNLIYLPRFLIIHPFEDFLGCSRQNLSRFAPIGKIG